MIKEIKLRKIFDSRGMPTVEAEVTDGKNTAKASSPSGTSRSKYEAVPFPNTVELGIKRFYQKKKIMIGLDEEDQESVDNALHEIDKTENFSYIGGAIATAVSIANAKLASIRMGIELYELVGMLSKRRKKIPRLLGNVFGGGAHAKKGMSMQEILLSSRYRSIEEEEKVHVKLYNKIGEYLARKNLATGKTIENAWTSSLKSIESLELVAKIARAEKEVDIGVDMAASEYFKDGEYYFDGKKMREEEYIEFVERAARKNRIFYIEDPFESSDYESFSALTRRLGESSIIVGDDLYATNKERIEKGVKERATNGVLIKVNQAGTLSDAINAVNAAKGMKIILSHRSGETTDVFLSHLAVGLGADFIKCGVVGGERVEKINELIRIERFIIYHKRKIIIKG